MRVPLRSAAAAAAILALAITAYAQSADRAPKPDAPYPEQPQGRPPLVEGEAAMTRAKLEAVIRKVDDEAQVLGNAFRLRVDDIPVQVMTDPAMDRMRILVGIGPADDLPPALLQRLMTANFESALDARYAIGQDVLWSTFIHPLSPLSAAEFLSGLAQTVNLATSFGTSFSSGALVFGGGDNDGQLEKERERFERLLGKDGQEI